MSQEMASLTVKQVLCAQLVVGSVDPQSVLKCVEVCVALSTPQIAGSEGRTGSLPDSSHVVHTPMLRTDGQARAQHWGAGGKEDSVGTQ